MGTYFDRYKLRIAAYGNSIEDAQVKSTIYNITQSFKESPTYKSLYINSVATDCRIIDTDKSYEKKLLFMSGVTKNIGDLAVIDNDYWLIVDTQSNEMFSKATIKLCNNTLKFYDVNNVLVSIPCIATNSVETLEDAKILFLPKDELKIIVPYTTNSNKITFNSSSNDSQMRFVLNGSAWAIQTIDRISKVSGGYGIVEIFLKSDGINEYDDMVNGIAYNGYLPSLTLSILNGSSANIAVGQTLQLNVEVTDNNIAVSPTPTIVYASSNISICTVSTTGLITPIITGTCTITATYGLLSDTISISVVSGNQNNYTVSISGSNIIKITQTNQYTCAFKNNGVLYNTTPTWSLFASDGISSTTLATISSFNNSNNTCDIKANSLNKYGSIILVVANSTGTITDSITIEVKSLLS